MSGPRQSAEPRQLVLDLPHRPALAAEDFLVSEANRAALDAIDRWPDWPHWALYVTGPARSGKSHLAGVWRLRSGAERVAAAALDEAAVQAFLRTGALVVEDLCRGISDERILFHLLNLAREHRFHILLTAQALPGELAVDLPDLRSRLRALPVVPITPPDDALLKAVIVKLFADRQVQIEPSVVEYLAARIERSFAAAHAVVDEIDRRALATRRRVTRALAAEIVATRNGDAAGEED